jgi:hypothetical protein
MGANFPSAPAPSRRLSAAVAIVVGVGAAAIAYWSDRKLDRWWKKNHPLAGAKARVDRTKKTYRSRRDFAVEAAVVAGELFAEISRARAATDPTNASH